MLEFTNYFAQAAHSEGSNDLFSALGIDWQMLVFQIVAFVILVLLLGKFVFPILMKAVDDRQAKIEESTKAAADAEKKAESAEAAIEATLKEARKEASDIVATAKLEATQMTEQADKKAKERTDRIVAEAQEDIEKQVIAARKTLENDTLKFVRQAAQLAVSSVADSKLDEAIVKKAVQEAKK